MRIAARSGTLRISQFLASTELRVCKKPHSTPVNSPRHPHSNRFGCARHHRRPTHHLQLRFASCARLRVSSSPCSTALGTKTAAAAGGQRYCSRTRPSAARYRLDCPKVHSSNVAVLSRSCVYPPRSSYIKVSRTSKCNRTTASTVCISVWLQQLELSCTVQCRGYAMSASSDTVSVVVTHGEYVLLVSYKDYPEHAYALLQGTIAASMQGLHMQPCDQKVHAPSSKLLTAR